MQEKSFESMALRYAGGEVSLLDQTKLPHVEHWFDASALDTMIEAIQSLRVRGAPLLGVAAAFCLAALQRRGADKVVLKKAAARLREARPTAVNLAAAVDRCLVGLEKDQAMEDMAMTIGKEDADMCERIADYGWGVLPSEGHIMTICNAGGLATAGIGTAIGVIRRAWESGKRFHVFVPETRPLGQGARLTTWELKKLGIPHTLICDNMVGATMAKFNVKAAVVGADRISQNGDFANKIGTYNMAILAKHHGASLYVAAPYTTFDKTCKSGTEIPIEERRSEEVRGSTAPVECAVFNPAFDVTPATLVSGWIMDNGCHERADLLHTVKG